MPVLNRRTALRGLLNGAAVTVAIPLLDCFLDTNGQALASGAPRPVRFGTWFWGLGVTPQRWFPDKVGPDYDIKVELKPIEAYKQKINVLSGFDVVLDGKPNLPHISGGIGIRCGVAPVSGTLPTPSFDVLIADAIGARTRFRSLELSGTGDPRNTLSGRGNGNVNPSEGSALGFYNRVFGADFKDPNSADFKPDPVTMARQSVLSGVAEQRQALEARVGAADKHRLDQYYTSLRQTEQQLLLQLEKPEPLEACLIPEKPKELPVGALMEDVIENHRLMASLLAMALACDQTRVFNINFNNASSSLTRPGSTITHHQLTHEEGVDGGLGYQKESTWFVEQIMAAWGTFVETLDAMKEGEGSLLDQTIVVAHSESQYAKHHTVEGIPVMTAGSGGGRIKTGLHIAGGSTPVSRVGLTLQQAMGVAVDRWGAAGMETNKPITQLTA